MAATTLFNGGFITIFDQNGDPVVGAHITVFQAGTSTPQPVYTNAGLSIAWSQPLTTNAAGQTTGPVFCTPTPALKIVCVDSNGTACPGFPMDYWSPSAVAT